MKVIRITAKAAGFRRCGLAHNNTPTDHPADTFSDEQLEILKNDPMLKIEEVEVEAIEDDRKEIGAGISAAAIDAGKVEALERRVDALNGQLAERASDLDELTAENEDNKAALQTARETIALLEGERDRLISDCASAIDEGNKLQGLLSEAGIRIADLEAQLAAKPAKKKEAAKA